MSTKVILVIFLFVGLSSCQLHQSNPRKKFEGYVRQLAYALETDPPPLPSISHIILPSIHNITLENQPQLIGLVDSYSFRQCGLFGVVARRNSILGKVEGPFRRFKYQLDFLNIAQSCLSSQLEPELALALADIINRKRSQLPVYWNRLLYHSATMRHQLGKTEWLDNNPPSQNIERALMKLSSTYEYVNNPEMLGGLNREDIDVLSIQETLDKDILVGPLIYSMKLVTTWLHQINQLLSVESEYFPNIPQQSREKTRHLKDIFFTHYAGEIQRYLSNIDSHYYRLKEKTAIFDEHSDGSYHYPLEDVHKKFRREVEEHVRFWRAFTSPSVRTDIVPN